MTLENGYYKRTKGTWIVEEITNEKNRYAIDDDGYSVATVVGETNANLIASAPDLLSAIKPLVARIKAEDSWAKDYDQIISAEAAIAKAEGKQTRRK